MLPQISVLIPFYNCEKYIDRCLESVAVQSFNSFEVVLVDDCSDDKSLEVALSTLNKHKQISYKLLQNPQNQGVAYCRNRLIENASGKYLLFVDADDRIEADMLEMLYNKAEQENADIVVSDFFYETYDKTFVAHDFVATSKEENIKNAIEQKIVYTGLWNKLIISDLVRSNGFCFPIDLNMSEDRLMVIKLYCFANKISKLDKPLYHYNRMNESSITATKTEFHYKQAILFWQYLDEFLQSLNIYEKYRQSVEYSKVENKVLLMQQVKSCKLHRKYGYLFDDMASSFLGMFPYKSQNLTLYFANRKMYGMAYLVNWMLRFKVRVFSWL